MNRRLATRTTTTEDSNLSTTIILGHVPRSAHERGVACPFPRQGRRRVSSASFERPDPIRNLFRNCVIHTLLVTLFCLQGTSDTIRMSAERTFLNISLSRASKTRRIWSWLHMTLTSECCLRRIYDPIVRAMAHCWLIVDTSELWQAMLRSSADNWCVTFANTGSPHVNMS
jgi:hypothetical protein